MQGGVQGGRVLSPGLVPALARPRLLRVAQLTRPACELIRILPPRVDKRCGRPITLPQPADSRLPNRCGGRWLPCVDAKVEPECVGHCVSARRVLLRAITGGVIAAGEVVSACQAIPCLRCPCNRPAGDVVITEHWLDRCVQAEKGPYLLRDHRPVRLHILVCAGSRSSIAGMRHPKAADAPRSHRRCSLSSPTNDCRIGFPRPGGHTSGACRCSYGGNTLSTTQHVWDCVAPRSVYTAAASTAPRAR